MVELSDERLGFLFLRLLAAFLVGWVTFFWNAAAIWYDGMTTLFVLPIETTIATIFGFIVVCALGIPLLINSVWQLWKRLGWNTLAFSCLGLVAMAVAWTPFASTSVFDSELKTMLTYPNPYLFSSGWVLSMFGIVFCPGTSPNNRREN